VSSRSKISETVQALVRERARYLCEYCHASEKWQYVRFTVEHVVPLSLGGTNDLENLAIACFHCNRRKTNRLSVTDPQSGDEVPLFNPRQHRWQDHFTWSADGLFIVGLTTIARITIETLALNRERVINIRQADLAIDRHPPVEDQRQTA
jgi:hypothetical protein